MCVCIYIYIYTYTSWRGSASSLLAQLHLPIARPGGKYYITTIYHQTQLKHFCSEPQATFQDFD